MLGHFLDKLKGGVSTLLNTALSSSDKDVMEAMVAASVLAAAADGDIDDDEVKVALGILASHPALEAFGDEPTQLFEKYCTMVETSKRTAKHTLMKEIIDMKGDKENGIRVLLMAIEVADSDNDIDADEMKVIISIAKELGLNHNDYI